MNHKCTSIDPTVYEKNNHTCSVTPLLKSLHWLPVQFRIKYKICTLTYKVIHSCQPVYLHNLLKPLNRTRHLRSSDNDQLVVPRVSSKMGERLRPHSSGIVSLLRLKKLYLQSFQKCWIYELERQTDNEYLGALEVFHFIHF